MTDNAPARRGTFLGRLALKLFFEPLQRLQEARLPDQDVEFNLNGYRLKAFPPRHNKISRYIHEHGVWEPEVTRCAQERIRPGMRVWDIGADVGYFSLLFAGLAGPQGRVRAFEPIPKARLRLEENLRLNTCATVEVESRALGSQPGKFILEKPLEVSRINPDKTAPGPDDIEVQVVRGDDVFAESGWAALDLIKLDVEGAELGILRGLTGVLQRHRPALILEIHGPYLPMFGASGEEVVKWLQGQGYQLKPIDRTNPRWNEENTTVWAARADG